MKIRKPTASKILLYIFGILMVAVGSAFVGVTLLKSEPCDLSQNVEKELNPHSEGPVSSINCTDSNRLLQFGMGIFLLVIGGFFCYIAHKQRRGKKVGD